MGKIKNFLNGMWFFVCTTVAMISVFIGGLVCVPFIVGRTARVAFRVAYGFGGKFEDSITDEWSAIDECAAKLLSLVGIYSEIDQFNHRVYGWEFVRASKRRRLSKGNQGDTDG